MIGDDKKEYRETLVLLSHMGSGPAVLNKLYQLIVKMGDPRLKQMVGNLGQYFRTEPEVVHLKKFRLLSWAENYSANGGTRKQISTSVQQYCDKHIASQVPAWQLISRAAGWTPPL